MSDSSSSSDEDGSSASSSSSEEEKKKKKKAKDKKVTKGKKDKKKGKKDKKKKDKKSKKKKKSKKGGEFGLSAQEKARLEAQQRGMGIVVDKKAKEKKKKKAKSSSGSSSSTPERDRLKRLRTEMEAATEQKEKEAEEKEQALIKQQMDKLNGPAKKEWDQMTWPERAAAEGAKVEAKAIWKGATSDEAALEAKKAVEAFMFEAGQVGQIAVAKRKKFDASKGIEVKEAETSFLKKNAKGGTF